jgi:hypothetical protein
VWYSISDINDWRGHRQHWDAFQERRVSLGDLSPFPQCHEYDDFHVDSITDNGDGSVTITDGSKDWTFGGGARKMWTEGVLGTDWPDWARPPFDVVLDADRTAQPGLSEPDARTVFQAGPIFDQPTADSVRFTFNLAKFCAELNVSPSSLVGRTGWILRTGGDNWTRGPLPFPNAPHWTMGVVTASAAATLTSDREIRHPAAIVGQQVVYLAGGTMQRGSVASVDGATRTLTFTGTAADAVVGQEFYVIPPGGYFQFGRTAGTAQRAYAGPTTSYYAHDYPASDGTTVVGKPRQTYPVLYGENAGSCPPFATSQTLYVGPDGLDVDYYVGFMNVCAAGDYFIAPDWWQCYRHLWCGILRLAGSFEPYGAADGEPHAVPTFSIALFLYTADIDPFSATAGTHTGTSMPCALGVPHTPINLWWSVLDDDGRPMLSGYELNYDGVQISGDFASVHDGKQVVASTGPWRDVERAVDALYDAGYFVPSLDDDGNPVVPPTATHPGTFKVIPKAATYLRADIASGQISRGTFARDAFANGHVARWVGHRKRDPGFPLILPADVPDALAAYHNHAYVGLRTPAVQARLDAARSGVATGGSARRIVVEGRDWDALDFMGRTNGLTHTFTPTSGSTTGCAVPGASGSGLWAAGRFETGDPMVGFCFEVIVNGADLADPTDFDDPDAVIEKRIIATGTTGGVLTWTEATSVSVAGKACRIVEPLVPNPQKDRSLVLRNPDGTTATVVVEGGHGDTLFIPDPGGGFVVGAGTSFLFDGPRVGDTVNRVSGQWVTTADAGADARYTGVDFQSTAVSNQPDVVREYGLPHAMDVTFSGSNPPGCLQVQAALATLKEFPVLGSWEDPGSNNRDATWHNVATTYSDWSSRVINGYSGEPGNTGYYSYNGPNSVSGAPFAHWLANGLWTWTGSAWTLSSGYTGRVNRQFNSMVAHVPHTPFPKTVLFYNYAVRFGVTASSPAPNPSVGTGAFDPNADLVAENVYKWWSTKSATTADVTSDPLGSLDVPNDAGAPASGELPSGLSGGESGTVSHSKGYTVTNWWVACRPDYVFG